MNKTEKRKHCIECEQNFYNMMELREKIAEIEHKQWVHWTRYFLNNLTPENLERWKRQCDTPYSELTEIEKDADRKWADQILAPYQKERSEELLKDIEVEEECIGHIETTIGKEARFICGKCNGTGKVRRPATNEDVDFREKLEHVYKLYNGIGIYSNPARVGRFVVNFITTPSGGRLVVKKNGT